MFEELRIFLVDNVAGEVYDLMVRAFDLFDDFYGPDIRNPFEELLFTQDESMVDTGDAAQAIVGLARYYLLKILQDHEIKINDEIDTLRLIKISEGVRDIQNYEDHETILNILNLELDSEEKFAELLSLVTDMDTSELLLELEEVPDVLFVRLKAHLAQEPQSDASASSAPDPKYLNSLKSYKRFLHLEPLEVFSLVEDGLTMGLGFNTYAGLIGRRFESFAPLQCAKELLGFALISADGIDNPKSKIQAHIENYIADFNIITQVQIKLTDLLLKYQIFKDHEQSPQHS